MVVFPPCKINLGLQVVARRPDGYHDIETCFYPVPWTDILEILPAGNNAFTQTGLHLEGDSEQNLCVRALRSVPGLPPVHVHLHKIIPSGAGLGGGSSDAAWTLRVVNQLFKLSMTEADLRRAASSIGSDCAFFMQDQSMMGSGKGEVLAAAQVNLSGHYLVIVKPDVSVSTSEAYSSIKPSRKEIKLSELLAAPVGQWRGNLVNDFEEAVFSQHPEIAALKEELYAMGALYASMSGSGSAVYGVFRNEVKRPRPEFMGWSGWL